MNKIKMTIMALAILSSVGGALATRPHHSKTFDTVYYYNGSSYTPAGVYMQNYICQSSASVCTYSFDGFSYTPYQAGSYAPILVTQDTKETKKK
jgi:hypothetical protein